MPEMLRIHYYQCSAVNPDTAICSAHESASYGPVPVASPTPVPRTVINQGFCFHASDSGKICAALSLDDNLFTALLNFYHGVRICSKDSSKKNHNGAVTIERVLFGERYIIF